MKVRIVLVVALLLVGAGLWWSASHAPQAEVGAAPETPSASASQAPAPSPSSTVSAAPASPSASDGQPSPEDSMSAADRRAVVAFAGRFAAVFARPAGRTDYRAWWRQVAAMMTDDAAADFMGTDPSQVPYAKVTGPISLIGGGDDEAYWLQRVKVPTDAGVYVLQVQLVTPGLSDRLLISGVEFP